MNGEDGSFSVESLLSFGLTELRAQYLVEPIGNALEASDPLAAWSGLSREHLAPEDPIELHRALHAAVMSGWDDAKVDNMYGSEYLSLFLAFLIIFFSTYT